MSAPYLSFEIKRNEWRYQRPVPRARQALYGGKLIRKWLGGDKKVAEIAARALASYHDGLFAYLGKLPTEKQTELLSIGGYVKAQQIAGILPTLDFADSLPEPSPLEMVAYYASHQPGGRAARAMPNEGAAALVKYEATQRSAALRATAERAQRLVLKSEPVADKFSWDDLFEHWKAKKTPRRTDMHAAALKLIRESLGERDYRTVTPHDADRFLKWMAERGVTLPMQHKHREAVSGMFTCAVPLKMTVHPFKGVTVDGEYVKAKKHPYTGAEERKILKMAASVGIGKEYKSESLWCVRLAAFMGCRINEAAQLQRGDVTLNAGVPVIYFRGLDAVTEKPHKEKNIKNGEDRCLALHPALWDSKHPRYVGADFRKYVGLNKANGSEFIFAAFEYKDPSEGGKGRGQYLINTMGKFVRDVCEITRPNLQPNHAFRHRMNDALRNQDWDRDKREAFLGQGGSVNRRYGDGKALVLMSKELSKVDPLADV